MKIMLMWCNVDFGRGLFRPVWLVGLSALLMAPLPARAEGASGSAAPAGITRTIPALPKAGHDGVVIDAIAAVVNQQAITGSEVEDAAWFARLSANINGTRTRTPLQASEYKQALQHLIDQDLLIQEQRKAGYGAVAEEAVQSQIDDLAQRVGGMQKLQERLQAFHLDTSALRELIRRQLDVLRFLDEKLRPSIVIDEQQIETYYEQDFIPSARAHKLQPAPLDRIRDEIRRILLEQEMGRQQQQWLQLLRASAVIKMRNTPLSPMG